MNMKRPRHHAIALSLAAASLVAPPLAAQQQRAGAPVTVNFVNADIEAVTRAMAAMINRPIVVDPRVKGQITVYSEQPQSVQEAYQSYQTALRGLGFAVVEAAGLLKVVPEADAKLQTGTVSVGERGPTIRGDQVITQIFPLRYENPNNLVAVLRPLISANNTINANPGSNSLVITDYADNLARIAKIIAALDNPQSTDLEVVPLQHAVAADLAPLVQRLSDSGPTAAVPGAVGAAGATTVVAETRSNSLIVRAANPARMATVKATIAKLDRPSAGIGPSGGLYVVHLKNADAVRLATVLRAAFGNVGTGAASGGITPGSTPGLTTPTAGTQIGQPAQTAQQGSFGGTSAQATAPVQAVGQVTTGGFIQADPATNSLIITAPEPLYRQVRSMIDQLDERRAQVYIESLIVEVDGGNDAAFGVQWQGLLGQSGDKTGVFAGTNFTGSQNNANIVTLSGAVAGGTASISVPQGLNIGILRNYGGTYALAAILNALQSQSKTNVVSTPNLITLDNEEAKIVVGQNVPFITGQFTNTGTATTSPFQTIERKDVGVTLRIRPQVGESGTVRMTIYQEQSSVLSTPATGTLNAGPSTTKRSIESQVVVEDGQIIVLGGLIEDRYEESKTKVPVLGDIPFLGALFRNEERTRRRTNLMVFLRPVVMRDADSTAKFSLDRYDRIRQQQQVTQPTPNAALPVDEAPVLPAGATPASPQGSPPFAPEPPHEKAPPAVRNPEAP
jgi:general secretion pathway protein D